MASSDEAVDMFFIMELFKVTDLKTRETLDSKVMHKKKSRL